MSTLLKEQAELEIEVDLLMERLGAMSTEKSRKRDDDDFDFLDEMSPEVRELIKQLLKRLKDLQCHFNWDIDQVLSQVTLERVIKDLIRKEEEVYLSEKVPWRDFYATTLFAYLYADKGSLDKAFAFVDEAKGYAERKDLEEIREGLIYVLDGVRAVILFRMKKWTQTERLLDSMEKFETLPFQAQAAVLGVRAASLIVLGMDGTKKALNFIQKAVVLDPRQAEWQYILGKTLSRIRRFQSPFTCPSDEECESLKNAVQLSRGKHSGYCMFYAQTLREKAKFLYYKNNNIVLSRELNQKAAELTNQALESNPNCPRINVRAADTFMKLPHPFRDYSKAEGCITKALQMAPDNTMVNHKAGTFYANVNKDYELAKKHFQKSVECSPTTGNFPAEMNLIDMEILIDRQFDPFPKLTKIIERYQEPQQVANVLCFRGCCHWILRHDLNRALENWLKGMNEDYDHFRDVYVRHRTYKSFQSASPERHTELLQKLKEYLDDCPSTSERSKIFRLLDVIQQFRDQPRRPPQQQHRGYQQRGRGRCTERVN